jgi:hypothetical protein
MAPLVHLLADLVAAVLEVAVVEVVAVEVAVNHIL